MVIGELFIVVAVLVPFALIVWYAFSSLGRITRGVEDIALTLRRIEQNGCRIRPE